MSEVIVALGVVCNSCTQIVRVADVDDMNGDTNYCHHCEEDTITTVGIFLSADNPQDLMRGMAEMKSNVDQVHEFLSSRNPPGYDPPDDVSIFGA